MGIGGVNEGVERTKRIVTVVVLHVAQRGSALTATIAWLL